MFRYWKIETIAYQFSANSRVFTRFRRFVFISKQPWTWSKHDNSFMIHKFGYLGTETSHYSNLWKLNIFLLSITKLLWFRELQHYWCYFFARHKKDIWKRNPADQMQDLLVSAKSVLIIS